MGSRVSAAIVLFLGMLVAVATAQYGSSYDDSNYSSPSKNVGSTNSSPAFMLALLAFIISFFVLRERI
ncbi:hypothetical protein RND71_023805 [Anisodus tanguticus]|uniref:Uncharacterized protein n=1 Tax=Anisodus tanguticus TaxID=243964 RepID=A0AAE1VF47_9SOLA|nr:hypothetical protein RND71_023805 [Anisodus tanguticus]